MLKWLRGVDARERRPQRVAVIDAARIDRNRSVVLIRRDNIEHLLMIGGPTDVVIEPKIVRTGTREPARPAVPGPARLPTKFSDRLTPSEIPPPPSRGATSRGSAPKLAPPAEPPPSPQTVHNLEELKRQLEVALSRSPAPQGRQPVTDPPALPAPPPPTVSVRPVAQPDTSILELERRSKPRLAKPEPKGEPKIEAKFEPSKPEAESKLEPKHGQGQPPEPQLEGEPAEPA
jgi:flagellar protein FliO/FliZ